MKKLIFILMVGSLFADTVIYKSALGSNRTIKNVEFTRAGNGKVFFKAFGQETSRDCIQIIEFTDTDGNKIDYDCSVIIVETQKNKPILRTINKSKSNTHLINSGERLIEFNKMYHSGFMISLIGNVVTLAGISRAKQGVILAGGGMSLIGGLVMLFSFNKVGQAGEELIDAGEKLEG